MRMHGCHYWLGFFPSLLCRRHPTNAARHRPEWRGTAWCWPIVPAGSRRSSEWQDWSGWIKLNSLRVIDFAMTLLVQILQPYTLTVPFV